MSGYYVYILYRPNGCPCYVGKGKGKRAERHAAKSHNRYLQRIINKAGAPLRFVKVQENMTEQAAFALEVELIKKFGRCRNGGLLVNNTDGGDGVSGHQRTLGQRARMSAARIGKPSNLSEAARAKISAAMRAKVFTPEHKAAISAAKRGRPSGPMPPAQREKIGLAHLGRKRTETELEAMRRAAASLSAEARALKSARISAALTGKKLSESHRASISRAQKGMKRSKEFREKVRAFQTGQKRSHESIAKTVAAKLNRHRERNNRIAEMRFAGFSLSRIAEATSMSDASVSKVLTRLQDRLFGTDPVAL